MLVRLIQDKDLSALWTIARDFAASPWTEAQVAAELQAPGGLALVIEKQKNSQILPEVKAGTVCGYAFFRIIEPEAELLQLTIASRCRRQGVASLLLRHGLDQLAKQGCAECFLEVRRSNRAAQTLYQRYGFQQSGSRKNYYRNPAEEALIFRLCLTTQRDKQS